jgi:ATP diphosphatase
VSELDRLLGIMAQLRDPENGCPWDLEQDFASIAPYTIEEAYEVADAIARADMEDLQDELGDLLLQVVYHARIAEERGLFGFSDVARVIGDKLVRRHPHVFGEAPQKPIHGVRRTWEETKSGERAARRARRIAAGDDVADGPFDDIPLALPALTRATKVLKRAERIGGLGEEGVVGDGFAVDPGPALGERASGAVSTTDPVRREESLGDLMLCAVALAARIGVDPERALADRIRALERRVRERLSR